MQDITYLTKTVPAEGCLDEIAPNIFWIRMPLPFALNHINLWAIREQQGGDEHWTIVDAGLHSEETKRHWQKVFASFIPVNKVRQLIVTHFHPDHIGLAGWMQSEFGLPVVMTSGEFLCAKAVFAQISPYSMEADLRHYCQHGLSPNRIPLIEQRGSYYRERVGVLPEHIERIKDGDVLSIGGMAWQVLIGYGHSPEHALLYCPLAKVLISGDMVLPKISTNVRAGSEAPRANPVKWFLESLRHIRRCVPDDTIILPSHGLPFRGLHKRVADLEQHHHERSDCVFAQCTTPKTAHDLLFTLFPFELDIHQLYFAMGEAIAHMNELVDEGRLDSFMGDDGMMRFVQSLVQSFVQKK